MALHLHDDEDISAIADAIRLKTDSVAEMRVKDMPLAIIECGGGLEKIFSSDFDVAENVTTANAAAATFSTGVTTLETNDVLLYQVYVVSTPGSPEMRCQVGTMACRGTNQKLTADVTDGVLYRIAGYNNKSSGSLSMYASEFVRATGVLNVGLKGTSSFPMFAGIYHIDLFMLGNLVTHI